LSLVPSIPGRLIERLKKEGKKKERLSLKERKKKRGGKQVITKFDAGGKEKSGRYKLNSCKHSNARKALVTRVGGKSFSSAS